jgi:hypothetical protein
MPNPALDVLDDLPGRALAPAPIEVFGREPKLDEQTASSSLPMMMRASEPPIE